MSVRNTEEFLSGLIVVLVGALASGAFVMLVTGGQA